ncbi:hypothetical protein LAZ67_20001733 [Cordylochernes scorpioides]|uniref:Transposase n=1 Tax=Cordylochernes scorpioides TaxID=51811 RepID=A0ABY6LKF1_9ARAC|nr:hypothetical protein LAZ67_20001733 [Cordylochernes scorpioides]
MFNGEHWIFQQDSAPAHKAKSTQQWLETNVPDFIKANEWPSGSPDLNPLDYSLWAFLEEKVCYERYHNLDKLKSALVRAMKEIPLEKNDNLKFIMLRIQQQKQREKKPSKDSALNEYRKPSVIKSYSRFVTIQFPDWAISRTSHQIVTKDLYMIRTSSKFVPRILTEEQKEVIMEVSQNTIELTLIDPERSQKSLPRMRHGQWILAQKGKVSKIKSQDIACYIFDIECLVHHEYIPFRRAINQMAYLEISKRLREAVRLKRPERWPNNDWILHVDNAQPHTANIVLYFLAEHSTTQLPHPAYFSDPPMIFPSILN